MVRWNYNESLCHSICFSMSKRIKSASQLSLSYSLDSYRRIIMCMSSGECKIFHTTQVFGVMEYGWKLYLLMESVG